MEYLHGSTLDKLLGREGVFSPMRLRRLLAQMCDVLQAAHDLGIVHRDLKPANLMVLEPDTPFEKLKVMDFGLAEMVEEETPEKGDRGEYAVGTPGYMPPEQVAGGTTDHRADLYSVGVIVYQMLAGRLPFSGGTAMEILMEQAEAGPPTFASLGLGDRVPATVEEVVRACLATDPDDRPSSARELAAAYEDALVRAAQEPEPAPAPTEPEPSEQFPDAEVFQLEAWLPEQIARHKLRGFVEEVGGYVVASEPGVVRVRLQPSESAPVGAGLLRLVGLCRWSAAINMELQMRNNDSKRPNLLHITVLLRPAGGGSLPKQANWKHRCGRIQTALRGYLMS
jgi:serine/threonine-protein kinase